MKHFTIENETNNITVHSTREQASAAIAAIGVENGRIFSNEAGLAKLAADWPASRLVDIWNSLPGVTPVTKFKDRATAVSRIWKAIQNLAVSEQQEQAKQPADEQIPVPAVQPETETPAEEQAAPVAPQTTHVAPEAAPSTKKATRAKKAPTEPTGAPREGSKTAQVIAMLKRDGGTTLEEIMTTMQWQKHTTRAMLSAGGSLAKKHGLTVISEKVGDVRRYSIKG